jgi:outer membrane receptor for monomeric catechols
MALVVSAAVTSSSLYGQGTEQLADELEYFIMEDFEVVAEEQVGYVVTNSTSGTRLNQPVKELPMPIEIISSDFIEDTGAESLQEALAFSAGLETNLTSTQV